MKILFATANKAKLREAAEILGCEVISPASLGILDDIEETGETLKDNSIIKANFIHERTQKDCFADDTGLEVDALNGAPGVKTARYAGDNQDDKANIKKILQEMKGKSDRRARFRTCVALYYGGELHFFEGTMEGYIAERAAGCGGFGYDPVFIPSEAELAAIGLPFHGLTIAEMSEETKNAISHRGKALRAMAAWLIEQLSSSLISI